MMWWVGTPSWTRFWARWYRYWRNAGRIQAIIRSTNSNLVKIDPDAEILNLNLSYFRMEEGDLEILEMHYRRKGWVVEINPSGLVPPCLLFSFPDKFHASGEMVPVTGATRLVNGSDKG